MITELSSLISRYMYRKNIIQAEEVDVYKYCFECQISAGFQLVLLAILGILFGIFAKVCTYVVYFCTLKRWLGGYHAASQRNCICIFTASCMLCSMLAGHIDSVLPAAAGLLLSGLAVFGISPIPHPNRPVGEARLKKCHVYARLTFIVQALSLALLYATAPQHTTLLYSGLLGSISASFTLFITYVKERSTS